MVAAMDLVWVCGPAAARVWVYFSMTSLATRGCEDVWGPDSHWKPCWGLRVLLLFWMVYEVTEPMETFVFLLKLESVMMSMAHITTSEVTGTCEI